MEKIRVHIAGLGAVGSHLVDQLHKRPHLIEALDIHGWDFDIVEEHNCANQRYSYANVGMSKAEALKHRFPEIRTYHQRYPIGAPCDILVMAVDTMVARKSIFRGGGAIHYLDTRLAKDAIVSLANEGVATNLDYGDDEAQTHSPCQSGFHADLELVLQSVDWLVEQIESIVSPTRPAYTERRLIGGHVIQLGGTDDNRR